MQIQQFVYTKVPPDKSPWKKTGFHMVLYPTGYLEKKDVLEIESKLHYPGQGILNRKRTVFFQKTKSGLQLVILFVRSLDTKDEFGREGMFLGQGFLIPESLWQQQPNPLVISPLLTPYLLGSIQEVLDNPLADFSTGNINPVEVSESDLDALRSKSAVALTDTEKRLLYPLYQLAATGGTNDALIVKGDAEAIADSLGSCLGCLPIALRTRLGFDPAFDNGKLFFFPLKLVGYSQQRPTTGDPLHFDLAAGRFDPHERMQGFTQPSSFYERWLAQTKPESLTVELIEKVYALCQFLEGSTRQLPADLQLPQDFARANGAQLRELFLLRAGEQVDKAWAEAFAEQESPENLLELILNNLAAAVFAHGIEQVILQKNLSPKLIKQPLPDAFTQAGSVLLKALMQLWKAGKLAPGDIQPLSGSQRGQLLHYLGTSDWATADWLLNILKSYPVELGKLLEQSAFANSAENWLASQFTQPYNSVSGALAEQLIRERAAALLDQPGAWLDLFERYLQHGAWSLKQLGTYQTLAKQVQPLPNEQPVLHALIEVPGELPQAIKVHQKLKRLYLQVLLRYHKQPDEAIVRLGYLPEEVSSARQALGTGVVGFVKRLFG